MPTTYTPLAETVVSLVGGPSNIASVTHCQTRLRFQLHDESQVRRDELVATDGVATAMSSGGTFQVVIGTHVKDVYDALSAVLAQAGHDDDPVAETPAEGRKRRNPLNVVIEFISATFQPIIPAMAGAGMISALVALLLVFGVIDQESTTYRVLSFFGNAVFYFLPIFVAFSAAQRLKTSPILAAVTAAMMLHPTWVQMVDEGNPVDLFGFIPLTLAPYASTVIPIMMIVVVQSYVERWFTRIIPNALKLVIVPMLTLLVSGVIAFAILGPIGAILGGYLASFFEFLLINAPWAPPLIVGTLFPIMVMFGVHNAVAPLGFAQLAASGYDSIWGPGVIVSNIATGIATLMVAMRTRDKNARRLAVPAGITALMGVTEPALYGITLPRRYPLIATMIGGGLGGLFAGLTATRRFAAGSSGLPATLLYIGDDTLQWFFQILIALTITIVTTAVLTYLFAVRYEKRAETNLHTATLDDDSTSAPAAASVDTTVTTQVRTTQLLSPVRGELIPLTDVPDPAFASGSLGDGVGIEPADGKIIAPVSGTVIAAMPSGHAFGIRTDDGVEVLVHVGIDTVQLKGEGFTGAVAQGSIVEAGQTLVTADLETIRAAGHPATVVFIVMNANDDAVAVTADPGSVIAGEPIMRLGA